MQQIARLNAESELAKASTGAAQIIENVKADEAMVKDSSGKI